MAVEGHHIFYGETLRILSELVAQRAVSEDVKAPRPRRVQIPQDRCAFEEKVHTLDGNQTPNDPDVRSGGRLVSKIDGMHLSLHGVYIDAVFNDDNATWRKTFLELLT